MDMDSSIEDILGTSPLINTLTHDEKESLVERIRCLLAKPPKNDSGATQE